MVESPAFLPRGAACCQQPGGEEVARMPGPRAVHTADVSAQRRGPHSWGELFSWLFFSEQATTGVRLFCANLQYLKYLSLTASVSYIV